MSTTLATKTRHLRQLSCQIFQTVHNPTHARTGHRILRERLAGPHLTSYYPIEPPTIKKLNAVCEPLGLEKLIDMQEVLRLNKIKGLNARNKGAPKKGEGKRAALNKKKK
ncbi:mitochondral 37S ribosomal protein S27 [Allomyces arbusculus]|nr:mitochondral 37S ribosomal protein S27 [Allomyces arbusculus]